MPATVGVPLIVITLFENIAVKPAGKFMGVPIPVVLKLEIDLIL